MLISAIVDPEDGVPTGLKAGDIIVFYLADFCLAIERPAGGASGSRLMWISGENGCSSDDKAYVAFVGDEHNCACVARFVAQTHALNIKKIDSRPYGPAYECY